MPRFRYSASTTLDAAGSGSVRIAPNGRDWAIRYLTVRTSTNVLEANASLYENYIGADYLIDATFTGSSGDTTDTVIPVLDGYAVVVEWTGGDPGAVATVTYTGDEV